MPDFFDRLPIGIERRARLAFETIGICDNLLQFAMRSLETLAARLLAQPRRSFDDDERYEAFTCAWSMVDRLHTINKVLENHSRIVQAIGFDEFMEVSTVATKLRNKVHHVVTNLNNMASRGGATHPILGIISFMVVRDFDTKSGRAKDVDIVVTFGSSLHHNPNLSGPDCMAFPAIQPFDHLMLHAFDMKLDLSVASRVSKHFRSSLAAVGEANLNDLIFRMKAKGQSTEDLKSPVVGPGTIVMNATSS